MAESADAFDDPRWLRVTLSSIGDAVITTDRQGKITFLNPAAESLTGWSLDEARGIQVARVFKIVNEETRYPVENPALRALRDGLVIGLANHTLLIARDGCERPIDDSGAPIRDEQGNIGGAVLVFRDITKRRAAEKALQESEERFRLLVQDARDYAIFILDPHGIVTTWNTGAERIKGYRADEIIGKHFSVFYPREVVASGFPNKELKIAAKEGRFEDEGWRLRKDGSAFWANVVITALRDKSGRLKGFSKITRDLTERRQMERLKIEAEALADLDRRKDEFLAMLSHELRNPLSPILSAVEILRLQHGNDAVRERTLAVIERQAKHLTRLIDDLLELSRISSGTIRLEYKQFDLRSAVERAGEAVASLVAQRHHQLSVRLPPEPVWIEGDAIRIEEVVVNLLTNAIKYTKEKGSITLDVRQVGQSVVLRVTDSGIGISADLLPHVFDAFIQADRSLDRRQGGLGIGLTIVRRIVELHEGTVQAFSAGTGRGSEFVVRLPLALPSPDIHAASDQPRTSVGTYTKQRVLLVDDNRDAADMTANILSRFGYDVEVAYSGADAVRIAIEIQPDVVLLDIGLPEVDGYEVARRFRREPRLKNVRLVALTGYGGEADRQKCHEAGFDAHVIKPASVEQIIEAIALPKASR